MLLLAASLLVACSGQPPPLERSRSRPAALRFGMHVTPNPDENPIHPPERFTGYHSGLDLEIFDGELDRVVPVSAICNGSVIYSGFAEGYGGLVMQRCMIRNESVTVLYGHLGIADIAPEDVTLDTGDRVGSLAAHRSFWSGWNRKHLHLGIRRGETMDMRGYVQSPEELADFIDPRTVLLMGSAGRDVAVFTAPGPKTRK